MTLLGRGVTAVTFIALLSGCSTPAEPTASLQDSCINPTRIKEQKILSDQEIQFTLNDGEVWLNQLPRNCPGLKFQGGFSWEVHGMQVCSNQQTIYVKDYGTSCLLGAFTRVSAKT